MLLITIKHLYQKHVQQYNNILHVRNERRSSTVTQELNYSSSAAPMPLELDLKHVQNLCKFHHRLMKTDLKTSSQKLEIKQWTRV